MTAEERLNICKSCLLARISWDNTIRCDSTKYMSPDGTKTSYLPHKGWIKGCGCLASVKVHNKDAHCIAGKW